MVKYCVSESCTLGSGTGRRWYSEMMVLQGNSLMGENSLYLRGCDHNNLFCVVNWLLLWSSSEPLWATRIRTIFFGTKWVNSSPSWLIYFPWLSVFTKLLNPFPDQFQHLFCFSLLRVGAWIRVDKGNEAPGQETAARGLWLTWSRGTGGGPRQTQLGQSRVLQASRLQASELISVPELVHPQSIRLSRPWRSW